VYYSIGFKNMALRTMFEFARVELSVEIEKITKGVSHFVC
jgi:hypothetical protein